MKLFLVLLLVPLTYGRSISKYEGNSEKVDSNTYMDTLLAEIRTGMHELDPVGMKDRRQTNSKGYYTFTETKLTGLSTVHRLGDTKTVENGDEKFVTANLTMHRLSISSILYAMDGERLQSTTGKVIGDMRAPDITLVVRISPGQPVVDSFNVVNFGLFDARYCGPMYKELEEIINEAIDFELETMYAVDSRDIIRGEFKDYIENKVRHSTYNPFKY